MRTFIFGLLFFSVTASAGPLPFPVFLKMGFSSVLEFNEAPSRVVLGDAQLFQVERLEHSLVIRALAPYATSNMFVYFRSEEPRMFVLTASEDAEPTYYKKFDPPVRKIQTPSFVSELPYTARAGNRILQAAFDPKKDFLTVEAILSANSKTLLKPKWDWIRLTFNRSAITPDQLWAERKEVQRDSTVRVRLIFSKPNVPRSLVGVALVVPVQGRLDPIRLELSKRSR